MGKLTVNVELDVTKGTLSITSSNFLIGPDLTLSEMLSGHLAEKIDNRREEEDVCELKLADSLRMGGRDFRTYLLFHKGLLISVGLKDDADEFDGRIFASWDDELQRKMQHDKWIKENFGDKFSWDWGGLTSYYDEVSWGAAIFLDYG